jgi:sugar/nucleoside kinase (ribokinase family)
MAASNPTVLCAGIIVADHVCAPIAHVPAPGELVMTEQMILTIGGCAANAAVDLSKMGLRPMIAGRVGDDAFGRIVKAMLEDHHIDTSAIKSTPGQPTSQTMIVNVTGQDRRFIHIFGANAAFTAGDIPLETVRRSGVLYVGGYLIMPELRQESLVPVFAEARRAGAKVVLDVVTPGKADYLSRLDQLLPLVDVFLPNNDEGETILGEPDPLKQAEAFRRMGAGAVVITMGSEGAILVSDRLRLRAGIYPVDFVDGSGGGDAFDAGYIYGLLKGLGADDCLRIASALGASCVRAIGTTPGVFTEPECHDFIRKNALKIEHI